jgi:hypothetical protein
MEIYLCADLYEAAFLLVLGARFGRIKEYYKNYAGKSFSILELEGVTFEMLQKLHDQNSTINYHKFKEQRKRIKLKIEKYAKGHKHKEISSKEAYKVHKELEKQYTQMQQYAKGTGPKRVIIEDNGQDNQTIDTSSL